VLFSTVKCAFTLSAKCICVCACGSTLLYISSETDFCTIVTKICEYYWMQCRSNIVLL